MVWSWLRRGGARGRIALLTAAVLLAFGATAIAWVATHQTQPPKPAPAAAGSLTPAAPPLTSAPSTPAPPPQARKAAAQIIGPTLAPSIPNALAIPAINVHSPLLALGRNPDGSLQVPQPGPHYNDAAWYNGLRTPGELGPAIIEGHVDSAAEGPSVFFRLGALQVGDKVYVTRADGEVAVFAVNAVRSYPKTQFPNDLVYGATADASLRLITCGGDFDRATGSYLSNVVVFAHLLKAQATSASMPAR
jgi:sortase (surface protein transpeptidase)